MQLPFNKKNYQFRLQEVKPANAACIIETDCNVDFDAPVGYQEPTPQSSAAPSPTPTATSAMEEEPEPTGIRIVDGQIVRPESAAAATPSVQVAERIGTTGVQKNAAIPEVAPEVDYWAVQAGDGARLDGKKPSQLKDADGNAIDVRKLRAEAAAKRAAAMATVAPDAGMTLNGKAVVVEEAEEKQPAVVSKRKSRVSGKYSRLKQNGAFQGSAQSFK